MLCTLQTMMVQDKYTVRIIYFSNPRYAGFQENLINRFKNINCFHRTLRRCICVSLENPS